MSEAASLGSRLCAIARASIAEGLRTGKPAEPPCADDPALAEPRASFVTLHLNGALRGCIGSLWPGRPLAEDVHMNAFAAAFRDPRFRPLTAAEFAHVTMDISVLTRPTPLAFASEQALLESLVVGRDGLLIRAGERQATFLPSVWEQLPEPSEFLAALKRKGGFAPDFVDYEALRYQCEHYACG